MWKKRIAFCFLECYYLTVIDTNLNSAEIANNSDLGNNSGRKGER